ncbi:unnamed protein product [Pylaiella littoralis]
MSVPEGEDRTRLDGFEIELVKLVQREATSAQWKEWLRAPLEHAAAKGNMELVTRLIDAGADESAGWRGFHGRTLLGAAAHGKNEKMVLAFLEAGAADGVDVVFNGAKGESALHVAASQGAKAAAIPLIRGGENPNRQDGKSQTPLHLAAHAGQHVMVRTLILYGANPNLKTQFTRYTALHLAAQEGHALCVSNLLLGGTDKDSQCSSDETPLHLAAYSNHRGAAEELLDAGANVNIRSFGGHSVLDIAAQRGHVGTLRMLLRHEGDVNASNDAGITPLHSAASFEGPGDNGGAVRALLAAGADIEAKEAQYGFSPLLSAAYCKFTSVGTINALLLGGADINAVDASGQTALHMLCRRSRVDAVDLLLQAGADKTLLDRDGKTAKEVVGDWRDEDVEMAKEIQGDWSYASNNGDGSDAAKGQIHRMLARTPTDWAWHRRGWLLLCRSYPAKVQLAMDSSGVDSSAKVAKASCDGPGGDGDKSGKETVDFANLVGRVVSLQGEDVLRLVLGFI